MDTTRILALDLRRGSVRLPAHGNRWEWFENRGIEVIKIYASQPPEGVNTIRVLPSISGLARYTDDMGITDRKNVVYVSDNERTLRCARDVEHFSTIAISPAPPELGDCASTSCDTTADLAGLINLLDQKLRPQPPPTADTAPAPPNSER